MPDFRVDVTAPNGRSGVYIDVTARGPKAAETKAREHFGKEWQNGTYSVTRLERKPQP